MAGALPLLEISDLTVEFSTRRGTVRAVGHVDVSVGKGETVGIVGESGSGKSVTSYAVLRILDRAGRIVHGAVHFSGIDLRAGSEDQMRNLRGREISMVFQNPRAALNPIRKVGHQIEDVLKQHSQVHSAALADEPTTGLDVTTQKTVMDLIVELTRQRGMSTILVTHDLGLAAIYCDRVVVMEKGRVVETAKSADIFAKPEHAYTKKLMRATPRLGVSLRDLLPEEDVGVASPRTRGEADARSAAGEGDPPRTVLAETAPHPDPLPVKDGEREKEKPLLLVDKLV